MTMPQDPWGNSGAAAVPPPLPGSVPSAAPTGGYVVSGNYVPTLAEANSKKLAAGLCAIFLGQLGIHKFILGYTSAGVIMLVLTIVTCGIAGIVMHVIGIIEGIMYLTKSVRSFMTRTC